MVFHDHFINLFPSVKPHEDIPIDKLVFNTPAYTKYGYCSLQNYTNCPEKTYPVCCSQYSKIYQFVWPSIITVQIFITILILLSNSKKSLQDRKTVWKWLLKILEQLLRASYYFHIFYLDNLRKNHWFG